MKIGVTAPGSSTNFVNALIAREGPEGGHRRQWPAPQRHWPSAVAAMKKGDIDAMSNLDPVMTKLEQDGDITVIADSRTGGRQYEAVLGGNNPAAVVYLKRDFIEKYPVTTQHIVKLSTNRLKWGIAKAMRTKMSKDRAPAKNAAGRQSRCISPRSRRQGRCIRRPA